MIDKIIKQLTQQQNYTYTRVTEQQNDIVIIIDNDRATAINGNKTIERQNNRAINRATKLQLY